MDERIRVTLGLVIAPGQLTALMDELAGLGMAVTMRMQPVQGAGPLVEGQEEPQAVRNGVPLIKVCAMCGLRFEAMAPQRQYCDSCKRERARMSCKRYSSKQKKGGGMDE